MTFIVEWLYRALRNWIMTFAVLYGLVVMIAFGGAFVLWDASVITQFPFDVMARVSIVVSFIIAAMSSVGD